MSDLCLVGFTEICELIHYEPDFSSQCTIYSLEYGSYCQSNNPEHKTCNPVTPTHIGIWIPSFLSILVICTFLICLFVSRRDQMMNLPSSWEGAAWWWPSVYTYVYVKRHPAPETMSHGINKKWMPPPLRGDVAPLPLFGHRCTICQGIFSLP